MDQGRRIDAAGGERRRQGRRRHLDEFDVAAAHRDVEAMHVRERDADERDAGRAKRIDAELPALEVVERLDRAVLLHPDAGALAGRMVAQARADDAQVKAALARPRHRHGGGLHDVIGARRRCLDERRNVERRRLDLHRIGLHLAVAHRPHHRLMGGVGEVAEGDRGLRLRGSREYCRGHRPPINQVFMSRPPLH